MDAKISLVTRILLGLIYAVFGLNFFLGFLPIPSPAGAEAQAFMGAIYTSKFLMVVKIIEIACGVLLLAGFFPRMAAILIMPISIGILLYHALMDPAGIAMGVVLVLINSVLIYSYRDTYKPMLS